MSYFETELRVHAFLDKQKRQEEMQRARLPRQIDSLREAGKLFGNDYPDNFLKEIQVTPYDWQISVGEEGFRFKKDFPYEEIFYGLKGWESARVVVNLDPAKSAIAFRVHLIDDDADISIDEGVLVKNGKIATFQQRISFPFLYRPIFTQVMQEQLDTKGESGCLIDHLKPSLDQLPSMVRQSSADSYGQFLKSFRQAVNSGDIDQKTMPRLALGWPLLSPYNSA